MCNSRATQVVLSSIKSVLAGGRPEARLTIRYPTNEVLGYGFRRGSSQRMILKNVRVVIEFQNYNGKPYYILTAFPDA
ncbi:RNase A-like domain-containing protein [Pantoea agglomerans]